MISVEVILAGMLVAALTFYILFAGADFGAGIWTLFAWGPGGRVQRTLIDRAIAPIWEANHVWLIIAVTILFTAFPKAFSLISTRLHLPLTLMLIAIVLRGTAFAVRAHDVSTRTDGHSETPAIWRSIFACSSVLAPTMLGLTLGAVASGRLAGPSGSFRDTFIAPWLAPFPMAVGFLTTALSAYLAAVYLVVESNPPLKTCFRIRAVVAWFAVAGLGWVALYTAKAGAPEIYRGLTGTGWGLAAVVSTFVINVAALAGILTGRDYTARFLAVAGSVLMLWGWALAQFPYLVEPTLTIYDAAPPATLRLLCASLVIGSVALFPFLFYLYRLFKGHVFSPAS